MSQNKSIKIRVCVILREGDAVLMVRHQKPAQTYWLLPGGGLEYGESIAECAIRELKEETNLDVEIGDLLFTCESIPPDGHRHVVNFFLAAELVGGKMILGDEPILAETRFVPIQEIPSLTIHPPVKRFLLEYLSSGVKPNRALLGPMWD